MEALAQAASFCVLEARGAEGAIGFLTGVDKAKFRHQVQPGDTLRLEADIVKSSSRMVVAEVTATVDGQGGRFRHSEVRAGVGASAVGTC